MTAAFTVPWTAQISAGDVFSSWRMHFGSPLPLFLIGPENLILFLCANDALANFADK